MRIPVLLAAAAASALVLTGCAGGEASPKATQASESCQDTKSGNAVKSIDVSGEFGAVPTVDFEGPLSVKKTEREVLIAGDGAETAIGDRVAVELTLYNATSGDTLAQTRYDNLGTQQIVVSDETGILPGIVRTIECVPAGSRVASVISPDDGFGDVGASDGSVAATDSLLLVADVLSITPDKATGADQAPVDGMPTVTLAKDGQPTVEIPEGDPSAELQIAPLKLGDGEVVQQGDTVTVHYQGVNWRTGEVFDQSWGNGPASFATTGVVPGFAAALEGATVGSQVLAVLPPAEGYGEAGQPSAGIEGTDTLVFVVDILATTR
ncbi:FKBP-type peptidyl-prolyl cis-trans isomerase [Mycetocola zhadangensis]|uniref:peptidylprolyl isomerase n=1 Tax=Mycetocola zhadangensis TaxID=1164595 RepID=A0A3L7IV37_9MICO|nr:FKBP-type peptidyl-prolyl cis-trans isomerase [Mycetocola zhadangensis]RLQ81391.1 peptidylprolyl isomerase [Mycetocola zhadangensis]GGF02113.1 peptidylprolyl isomerase [Mycetocola zhadangensis]